MTDNEIIKALECCGKNPPICIECSYKGKCNRKDCYDYLKSDALDLIARQKAEIERLKTENKLLIENDISNKYPICVSVEKGRIYTRTLEDYDELIGDISSEGIKEFAERLCEDRLSNDSVVIAVKTELKMMQRNGG